MPYWQKIVMIVCLTAIVLGLIHEKCYPAEIITASYYTRESCLREGTSGIMANGKELKDEAFTCASWDHAFGSKLRVYNLRTGESVVCVVSDRGPNRKLYRQGRKIDLSKAAFNKIAPLREGVIPVRIEVIR